VVLSTRSFTQPYYNIDVILETAPRVRERHPDVHYLFGGLEGNDERFRREAERKGMTGWVHWLGRIPHGELPAVLGVADAFLTVPSVDATAVSLLEAMACGTPVVASDLPSATEWVRDGETGLVVPPRNATALVNAVDRLLSDGALRARLGRAAREVVAERADHDRHMQRVEEIYYDLAEGRSPRPAEASA
jgi:glycosyltransferase involved in cell wall biosynthesis